MVTTIAPAHLEGVGSIEGVQKAKGELVEAIPPDGVVVLNADDPLVLALAARARGPVMTYGQADRADVRLGDVALVEGGLGFRLAAGPATADVRLPLAGRHNAWHAAAAAAVGLTLGVPLDEAAAALALAVPVKGRLVWREAGGVRILDDTYNANPVSVRAALDALREAPGGGRRWVILGDMLELGTQTRGGPPRGRGMGGRAPRRRAGRGGLRDAPDGGGRAGGRLPRRRHLRQSRGRGGARDRPRRTRRPRAGQGVARHADGAGGRGAPGGARHSRGGVAVLTALAAFAKYHIVFNVFRYITFRTAMALVTALVLSLCLGPWMIRKLRERQIGETIRTDGPERHRAKAGTPTMGGLLIVGSLVASVLLWGNLGNRYVWVLLFVTVALGAIGFYDDWRKLRTGRPLKIREKFLAQLAVGLAVGLYLYRFPSDGVTTQLSVPFVKEWIPDLGAWYILFAALIVVGASNAVNLTDGLDGLAMGPVIVAAVAFGVIAYVDRQRATVRVPVHPEGPGRRRADGVLRRHDGGRRRVPVVQQLPRRGVHGRRGVAGARAGPSARSPSCRRRSCSCRSSAASSSSRRCR